MMNLIVRKATIDDIPVIVEVRLSSVTEEETRGFVNPGCVAYSVPEELGRVGLKETV
jgi:hypothetical protein